MPDEPLTKAFDVDGVIADVSQRLATARELAEYYGHDFWEVFFSDELLSLDKPRRAGVDLVRRAHAEGFHIIIITGRPSRLRDFTLKQVISYTGVKPDAIYLRRDRDRRPAKVVKAELLGRALRDGFEVIEYHDDSEDVLREIRAKYPWITLFLHVGDTFQKY